MVTRVVRFLAFGTESGRDTLRIRSLDGGADSYLFSGSSIPDDFLIQGREWMVEFESDGSIAGPGFSFSIEQTPGYNTTKLCLSSQLICSSNSVAFCAATLCKSSQQSSNNTVDFGHR